MLYSKLGKNIYSLALLSFLNGLGSFVFPFLSLFLITKVGYSTTKAGIFIMICAILYVPSSLLSSKLSDKYNRKKIMIITQILFSIFIILSGIIIKNYILVPIIIQLALIFDGATDPARGAVLQDCTTLENRQVAFSLFYLCENIGFGIGASFAGFLFNNYTNLLFFGTGALGLVGAIFVLITVDSHQPTKKDLEISQESILTDQAVKGSVITALLARPKLLTYMITMTFYGLIVSMFFFGMPLYCTDLFGQTGPSNYGILMFVNATIAVIFTPFITKFSKGKYPLRNISIGVTFYGLSFYFFGLTNTMFVLIFIMIFNTIGEVFHVTNNDYYIANHTPMGHRARFSSVKSILLGAGSAFGPYLAGIILESHNYKYLFNFSALLMLVILLALLILRHKDKD